MPASELELMNGSSEIKKRLVVVVVSSTASGVFMLSLVLWFMVRKRKKRSSETENEDLEQQLFDLATTSSATNNFSDSNLIGNGGFEPIYKGTLATGQEIAVKRLSNNSGQGFQEFKNEVILIVKLQHHNFVRLLGYCVEEERMLIYQYMPNKSLDCFIFGLKLLAQKRGTT
ncbi:G-type lectin S-receptor-like serine/threonine-protein kinase RKS1 [Vitis vinifera]|uniref:non-specific serine/threonine protein kinase n=1 Tax=Vitis vinifera TaxID=29760 RepID=A0A438BMY8_VITVI|nr:G-type lectin S-receptor-like serine/threonine-protein kinase RKS1 [Vitis vinifera]